MRAFRDRLTFERAAFAPDDEGGAVRTTTLLFRTRGRVQVQRGGEGVREGGEAASLTYEVFMRKPPIGKRPSADDTLIWHTFERDIVLNIRSVVEADFERQYFKIFCEVTNAEA